MFESNETKIRFLEFLRKRGKEPEKPILHIEVEEYIKKFHDSKENHN